MSILLLYYRARRNAEEKRGGVWIKRAESDTLIEFLFFLIKVGSGCPLFLSPNTHINPFSQIKGVVYIRLSLLCLLSSILPF